MKPLILLDIDGVLNPAVRPGSGDRPALALTAETVGLVRRLATCGRIAWVSSWPSDVTAGLESELQLAVEPLRVTLTVRDSDGNQSTPKLRSVARWLARMEASGKADWDSVVWIDDVLGPDAREWARHHHQPVLLQKPPAARGLTDVHVVAVEVFVGAG